MGKSQAQKCPFCRHKCIPVTEDDGRENCRNCGAILQAADPTSDELPEKQVTGTDLSRAELARAVSRRDRFRGTILQAVKDYIDKYEDMSGIGHWLDFQSVGDIVIDFADWLDDDTRESFSRRAAKN